MTAGRFQKVKGKRRYIDTFTGQEVSERQRNKVMKVGDYRPLDEKAKLRRAKAERRFTRVKGSSRYIDNVTGKEVSDYQRRLITQPKGHVQKVAKKSRLKKRGIVNQLSRGDKKSITKLVTDAYNRETRFITAGVRAGVKYGGGERLPLTSLLKDYLAFVENPAPTLAQVNTGRYSRQFNDLDEWKEHIKRVMDELGFNTPDFNKYMAVYN